MKNVLYVLLAGLLVFSGLIITGCDDGAYEGRGYYSPANTVSADEAGREAGKTAGSEDFYDDSFDHEDPFDEGGYDNSKADAYVSGYRSGYEEGREEAADEVFQEGLIDEEGNWIDEDNYDGYEEGYYYE